MSAPDWTERLHGAGNHEGRWALGLESMGFRISRELIPPLTNTTRRVRYYPFFCWIYWTFARHEQRKGRGETTLADQKAWRMRLENAFRTATARDPDYTHGLIGFNSRISLKDGEPYAVGTEVGITAWQAEYYKPSWLAFGFGHLKGDIVVVDPTRGVPLAQAFDNRIRSADPDGRHYRELVSDAAEIRSEVIVTLGRALALRRLDDDDERERILMVDRLFHLRPSSSPDTLTRNDWTRSLSLTLLLDLVASGEGSFVGANDAYRVFATGRYPDNRPYTPPSPLETTYAQWERYQERQQEKLALYAFWDEVILAIRDAGGGGLSGEEILHWVLRRARESEALRNWLGERPLNLSVEDCIERLESELGAGDAARLIQELTDYVIDGSRPNKAGAAVLILLLLAQKWEMVYSTLPAEAVRVHTSAAPRELPLHLLTRRILSHRSAPLGHLLRHVVEQWVLAQSLRVALEKWSHKQDRFFIARDHDGYRVVQPQDSKSYLSYDPPRIDSSLEILQDLRLVEREKEGFVLTSHGQELRREALAFHEERLREQMDPATLVEEHQGTSPNGGLGGGPGYT